MTDSALRYRLMHAGAGLWLGLIVGVIVWLSFFSTAKADVTLYCLGIPMCLFALVGLMAPKSLVDTFLKTLRLSPWPS